MESTASADDSRESGDIIEVEGLEHRYGDFVAVNGISFTVR